MKYGEGFGDLAGMDVPMGTFKTAVSPRRKPYEGRYTEFVSIEPLDCGEYKLVEKDPAHGTRIIWVNEGTGRIMLETQ